MLPQQEVIAQELHIHEEFILNWLKNFLGDRETAMDVKQSVFLHVLEFAARTKINNPKAFMFKVARNLAYSEMRRRIRHDSAFITTGDYSLDEISQEPQSTAPSPEQSTSIKDEIGNLFRIINTLPKRQRQTIMMHRVDGLSYKEIAQKLDVSVSSVEKYMSHALKTIHHDVDGTGPAKNADG